MAEQQHAEQQEVLLSIDIGAPPALTMSYPGDTPPDGSPARAEDVLELEDFPEDEPIFRPGRWVVADWQSGALRTEPGKSNAARAHTLLGVAQGLRQAVTAEERQLIKLQEAAESEPLIRALGKLRQRHLHSRFQRRLRDHMDRIHRLIYTMLDVCGHFDPDSIEKKTGGPALRLLDIICPPEAAPASASSPAANTSLLHTPEDRQCEEDGKAKGPVAPADNKDTLKTEACAGAISSSEESSKATTEEVAAGKAATEEVAAGKAATEEVAAGRAATEEVAAGKAATEEVATGKAATEEVAAGKATTEEVAAGKATEVVARRMSLVPWRHFRFEKKMTEPGTSSTSSSASRSSDSLMDSAGELQSASADTSEAAVAVDTLVASVEESEQNAATQLMGELQQHFLELADMLRHQGLICDSMINWNEPRGLLPEGVNEAVLAEEEKEAAEGTAPEQRLLKYDVALVISQMQLTQACVSRSVAALQRIVDGLPPTPPSAARLPPTPPYASLRTRSAKFQAMLRRAFQRKK